MRQTNYPQSGLGKFYLARGWPMEGDAPLPLHEVRRDERGRAIRRAARSYRSFGREPKLLRTLGPLWRASLVTFLHAQESDIPPLFARRRKFPATRSVAKACASSSPARRRRRQPQAPPRAAWHPSPQAASGTLARDAFFLAKSTPLAAARQFTPQKSAFTEKEFRALRSAAKGAAFGIRSL